LKKNLFVAMLTVLLVSVIPFAINIYSVKASGTIYIRADGSIDPATALIHREGNVYHFTGNISETVEVQKDNIEIDGRGYTLLDQTGQLYGFYLNDRSGVTIKNTTIIGFDNGIDLTRSRDCTISGNNITNNYNGIHIHFFSNEHTIKDNNITNNTNFGIMIYGDSIENVVYHNNFIDNYQQASAQFSASATWDNGTAGNYWSDYTGVDAAGDGIGDTPYMIDEGSQDRYPLMNPWIPVAEAPPPPTTDGTGAPPFWTEWWFFAIIAVIIVASAGAVFVLKKRK